MTVELSPIEDVDIDQAVLDFAREHYCANCAYFSFETDSSAAEAANEPYCEYWEESTRVEPGMICSEYLPQGYE